MVLSSFPEGKPRPGVEEMEFGYVEPGHGLRGKMHWILDEDDVQVFLNK